MDHMSKLEELTTFYTNIHGEPFELVRKLSFRDYNRMCKKLHCDPNLYQMEMLRALIDKDVQRLRRVVERYIEEESKSKNNPILYITHNITVRKMEDQNYMVCYEVFCELSVREPEKQI